MIIFDKSSSLSFCFVSHIKSILNRRLDLPYSKCKLYFEMMLAIHNSQQTNYKWNDRWKMNDINSYDVWCLEMKLSFNRSRDRFKWTEKIKHKYVCTFCNVRVSTNIVKLCRLLMFHDEVDIFCSRHAYRRDILGGI